MKKLIIFVLIASVCMFAGCGKNNTVSNEIPSDSKVSEKTDKIEETTEIVLYYPDNQGVFLCKEQRQIPAENSENPEYVLRELIKGTEDEKLSEVIPDTVQINSCLAEDGLCTVDFSKEFFEIQGTASQEMAIYSVVNTLCEFENIDSVQFLIDGQKMDMFGNYDFASAFEADLSFVKAQ